MVSSESRVKLLQAMGCDAVIDRRAEGYQFWSDEHTQDEGEWRRLGKKVRELVGEDPDIVFEHPGRSTMGASVFIAKQGGKIVTCAATSGYMIEYDNRHLWMKLKSIVSSHFANYQEAWNMNRLIDQGAIQPVMCEVFPLDQVGEAALQDPPQPGRGQARRAVPGPRGGPGHRRSRQARGHRRGQDHPVPAARTRRAVSEEPTMEAPDEPTPPAQMLLTEIDHVAIAVRDLDAAVDFYQRAFGATVAHREVVDSDGVEEALVKVADSYIQLTAATRPDSPIAKAIEKRGEGLHHVGYRVDDCQAALDAMVAAGCHAHRRGAPARLAGHHGGLHPPQGRLRHADRAGPGVARPPPADPAPRAGPAVVGCAPTDSERGQ